MSEPIRHVRIVGAGNMGVGIAADLALAGIAVELVARSAKRREVAETLFRQFAAELSDHGMDDPDWVSRIRFSEDIPDTSCDVVIEAIVENAAAKNALFRDLQAKMPAVPIWSTTSAIPASDMTDNLPHPENVLVAHYANPAHLVPVVEVVPGPRTAETVVEQCVRELTRMGKAPVVIRGEPPGFVFNRLQYAVMREAVSLVERGIISAQDLDRVVTEGYGIRLPAVGPLAMVDLSTAAVYARISDIILADLSRDTSVPALERMAENDETFLDWADGKQDERRAELRRELLRRRAQRRADAQDSSGKKS